jgi:lysine/ornithine N-monooxygenase
MGSIELTDGAILEVDSVLFATGYYHSYPFLSDFESRASVSEDTKIVHGQYTVLNLHDDLFYIRKRDTLRQLTCSGSHSHPSGCASKYL